MSEEKNKQYYTLVTLLVILIIMGIGLVVDVRLNHLKVKEKEHVAYEEKKDAIERLYYEVKYEFENFTSSNARWWNEGFAKLTLNHTRDTVKHPEYTIKEFAEYHQDIMTSVTNLKDDKNFTNRFAANQIQALFPLDFKLQHFLGTIRVKERLFKDVEKLDGFSRQILNTTKKTDVVKFKYSDLHSPFVPYFKLLREMDKTIYDLMASRYPDDLVFLGNTYPDLVKGAKDRLFGKQTYSLLSAYYGFKQEGIQPEKQIQIVTNKVASDTTITMYKVFKNRNKTLLAIYTDKEVYPMTTAERKTFLDNIDALVSKGEYEEKRYYYVDCIESGPYYATDTNKTLAPHVLENDDAEILQFYDDDSKRYYILGDFNAFDIYYPCYEENKLLEE